MNFKEAMEYVEELQQYGSVLGLESMQRLCKKVGNPQDELTFVHIAGTNGKGSVLAYVSTVLKCAGYKVGRYLSPTIKEYRERFQIDGKMITQAGFCKYLEQVKEAALEIQSEGHPHPTPFEVETVVAFLYFLDKQCDIVVLETGLGGNLDATNVIKTTAVSVFTSISMDHMGILGNRLEDIALAKSGIIKDKCHVVSTQQHPEVMTILKQTATTRKAKFSVADVARAKSIRYGVTKQSFDYGGYKKLEISLLGKVQIENAVVAVETIEALSKVGFPVKEEALRKGLLETAWAGRFSIIGKRPLFIADGAHNEDAARKLRESIELYFQGRRMIFIMGVLRDKEYEKVIAHTVDLAEHVITITPKVQDRALHAYDLAQAIRQHHDSVTVADSIQEAVEIAYLLAGRDKDTVIIAFGSLSYLGELMYIVEHRDTIRRDTHGKSEEN